MNFSNGKYGAVAAFPHVFMFGTAYNKNVSNITQNDSIHLLMQFSVVPATCQMLIFYLFDIHRRHSNICEMSTYRKADPSKFNEFSEEVMPSVFQEKLKNAVAYPDSRDAKYVLNKFLPVLAAAGKHTALVH